MPPRKLNWAMVEIARGYLSRNNDKKLQLAESILLFLNRKGKNGIMLYSNCHEAFCETKHIL